MTVDAALDSRVLDELRAATGRPDLEFAAEPERLTGGFWAELLAFRLQEPPPGWPRDLVARVMPEPQTARKESVVQRVVAASGFPTPAVRLTGGPDSRVGQAFMIMDRATGAPLMSGLNGLGPVVSGLRETGKIPNVLASTMAALHAVDPRPVRDELAGLTGISATVPGMLSFLTQAAGDCGRADLVDAARFLTHDSRPPGRQVICHGDLHPFNVLTDGDGVTVLDWSASLLGSPVYDVAFTTTMLAEPPLVVPAALRQPLRGIGRLLAGQFLRRYQAHAGLKIGRDDLRWHQAIVCLRILVEVAGWVQDGSIEGRSGHPFLICGRAHAVRLASVTGIHVRPR
ncbi:MAG TPA: phosphotransferase [Streptosporangiaceae bacterium]|nr:phosphotransferase [Streptosporangiaceae bacterium]